MYTFLNNTRGFVLIEAMVALAVFTIGIIGCLKLQHMSTFSTASANRVTSAVTWGSYIAEQLLTQEYDATAIADTDSDALTGLDDTKATADGQLYVAEDGSTTGTATSNLYAISWNIVDNYPLQGTKLVRVIVEKTGSSSSEVTYTHDYYKTEAL